MLRRWPTCLEPGCAPTREETQARMRWTSAQLRDLAKRLGIASDNLNAAIERCEQALRVGEFRTAASTELSAGVLWWDNRCGNAWRLLYANGPRDAQVFQPLTSSSTEIRMEATHEVPLLLDALLAAEEE